MTHLDHMERAEQAMSLRDWPQAEEHARAALQVCTDRYARAQIALIRDGIVERLPRVGMVATLKGWFRRVAR